MNEHEKINYIEFPASDIPAVKAFFGINGGFFKSEQISTTANGSALVVFYSKDLASTQAKIEKAGGVIVQKIFSFPGGRRFHFSDPNGNEYAVWSDVDN